MNKLLISVAIPGRYLSFKSFFQKLANWGASQIVGVVALWDLRTKHEQQYTTIPHLLPKLGAIRNHQLQPLRDPAHDMSQEEEIKSLLAEMRKKEQRLGYEDRLERRRVRPVNHNKIYDYDIWL